MNKTIIRIALATFVLIIAIMGVRYIYIANHKASIAKKYKNHAQLGTKSCLAITPECGFCPSKPYGEVVDGVCYWDD